jgi:succinyl-CoA synthetase beta subunit
VAEGVAIFSADEAEAAAKSAARAPLRGQKPDPCRRTRQGQVQGTGPDAKGGVRLAFSIDEVKAHAKEMLGNTLVTKQTGDAGKQVNRLYIEDGADIERELYSRSWSTAPSAARPSWCPPKAAWTSRRWPRKRRKRSSRVPIDPETGDGTVCQAQRALELTGAAAKDGESCSRSSTRRLSRRT